MEIYNIGKLRVIKLERILHGQNNQLVISIFANGHWHKDLAQDMGGLGSYRNLFHS